MSDGVIDLGVPAPGATQFYILRSQAIDTYSGLERSLSSLLGLLMGGDMRAATSIFHRLSNTKSRNLILEDLLSQRFGDTYQAFWHGIPKTKQRSGLMTIIQSIDGKRNEIVHWTVVRNISDTSDMLVLRPPAFFFNETQAQITAEDLTEFIEKADFASRAINMFTLVLGPQGGHIETLETWLEIFRRPCAIHYPGITKHRKIRLGHPKRDPQSGP